MLSDLLPPELWVLILDNLPVKVLLRTQREPYLNLVVRNHLYEKLQRWAVGLVQTNEIRKRIANDRKLKQKIRTTIRANASPRHVPAKIIAVPDIPYTLNMKKVELAVKKVIQNKPVTNKDALKNPEALDYYAGIAELQED